MRQSVGEGARLAATGAGEDQHRSLDGLGGSALLRVQPVKQSGQCQSPTPWAGPRPRTGHAPCGEMGSTARPEGSTFAFRIPAPFARVFHLMGKGRLDEAPEQGMGAVWSRLELRMELGGDEERMVGELDHLDQVALG